MKKEENIKIKTYKGVDIFYTTQNGRLLFNFEGRELEAKYLFEVIQIIDEPIWEECDLIGYFIDGVFKDYIGKAKAIKKDKKSGKPYWKFMDEYDSDFKEPDYWRKTEKVFLKTKKNDEVFERFKKQKDIVLLEKAKLKDIISNLI